ncbi:MAG: TrpB-like pyridoxal-phosphate dependent enzyme, partial [Gammaproteobacteria bacterium]|nr:TrpB-like pyridoxal-phosphate dependent enzyme [Gammaproteobacteria bacterium]
MDNRILLPEAELPTHWYNAVADLPSPPPPPVGPDGKPVGLDALAAIFPMGLIEQEVSGERWIEIPEEVRDMLRIWRPTPLVRAHRLEKALDTPAKIYYKNE